jgi:hypothetical protein
MSVLLPAPRRLTFTQYLVTVGACMALTACDNDELTAARRALATVTVSLETTSIEVGQTVSAEAAAFDQQGAPIAVKVARWTSVQSAVADVNEATGLVRAVAPGSTRIVASVGGVSGERSITVVEPPTIRINEVAPRGTVTTGWLELFNPTAVAIDVSGWKVVDDTFFGPELTLPARSIIPARGFLVIEGAMLPFAIDAIDDVRLISRYGVEVDRLLRIMPLTSPTGRCPDGGLLFVPTPAPTKGAANLCPSATGS